MKTKPTGREGGREGENSVGFNELEFLDEDNKDEKKWRDHALPPHWPKGCMQPFREIARAGENRYI